MKKCLICDSINLESAKVGSYAVLKCLDCTFLYLQNSHEYLEDNYFDNYYSRRKSEDDRKTIMREQQYEIDKKFVNKYLSEGDSILDVGCSSGKFLSVISRMRNNLNCVGIDVDQSGIAEAQKSHGSDATYMKSNLLSVGDQIKFDIVIFRGTLQYLGDEFSESMHHLGKILSPKGKVIIFVLPSTDSFMFHLLQDKWPLFHPEQQLYFNEKSIRHAADLNGLSVELLNYPYLNEAYSNVQEDYENVRNVILGLSQSSNPFWGSVMNLVLKKKPE